MPTSGLPRLATTSTARAHSTASTPTTRRLMTSTRLGARSTTTRALMLRTRALGVRGPHIVTSVTTRLCSPRSMLSCRARRLGKSARTTRRSAMSSRRCAMQTARTSRRITRSRTSTASLNSSSDCSQSILKTTSALAEAAEKAVIL